MKDLIGDERGLCSHEECISKGDQCPQYFPPSEKAMHLKCLFCDHLPRYHAKLSIPETGNVPNSVVANSSEVSAPSISLSTLTVPQQPSPLSTENIPEPVPTAPVSVVDTIPTLPTAPVSVIDTIPSVPTVPTSINNIVPIYKYLPETISEFVVPLTNGKFSTLKVGKKMEKGLRHEITMFLDKNQLIMNVSPQEAKMEYSKLRMELTKKWPKLITNIWDGEESRAKTTIEHARFVKTISTNRKTQRLNLQNKAKNARELGGSTSIEQYHRELQSMTSKELDSKDIPFYLRATMAVRLQVFPQELPIYLRSKENIFEEIQLRTGSSIDEMKAAVMMLLNLYSKDQAGRIVSLQEIEQHLHQEAYIVNEKGELTKNLDHSFFLDLDDEFEYSELELHPRSGYCVKMTNGTLYLNDMKNFYPITGHFSLNEAAIIGYGAYFIFYRLYPRRYCQFLGLLEIIIKPRSVKTLFPRSERKPKLIDLLKRLNIK